MQQEDRGAGALIADVKLKPVGLDQFGVMLLASRIRVLRGDPVPAGVIDRNPLRGWIAPLGPTLAKEMPLPSERHDPGPMVNRKVKPRIEVFSDVGRHDAKGTAIGVLPSRLNRLGLGEAAAGRACLRRPPDK